MIMDKIKHFAYLVVSDVKKKKGLPQKHPSSLITHRMHLARLFSPFNSYPRRNLLPQT